MEKQQDRMVELGISARDIRDFEEHPVWRCISGDLQERLELTRDDLEAAPMEDTVVNTDNGTKVITGVQKLQGAAGELKYIMSLPQIMISDLESFDKEGEEE